MAHVGLLGGTFNPPHVGHLACAQDAHAQLGLDCVIFVPAGVPPHKAVPHDPGAEHRLELCRRAVSGDERFAVSRVELDRPGPSFTVDTLRELHERASGDDFTLIVGADMALSLPTWREPAEILSRATVAVAAREGVGRTDIMERLRPLAGADAVRFFDMPRIDVSSSAVRRRVARGEPIRYLVPEAVAEYIAAQGLYQPVPTRPPLDHLPA